MARSRASDGALPGLAAPGAIGGASGVPGPTDTRARSHHDETDLSADGPRQPATGFIHGRSDEFDEELIRNPADCRVDRKSTRLNSSHANISYAVFCLKKKIVT